jgi:hypothetical protein
MTERVRKTFASKFVRISSIDGLEHRVTIREVELQWKLPAALLGGKGFQSFQISHNGHDVLAACQPGLRPEAAEAPRRAHEKPNYSSGHDRLLMVRKA